MSKVLSYNQHTDSKRAVKEADRLMIQWQEVTTLNTPALNQIIKIETRRQWIYIHRVVTKEDQELTGEYTRRNVLLAYNNMLQKLWEVRRIELAMVRAKYKLGVNYENEYKR